MVIMRTAPDATGAERQDAKNSHDQFRQAGAGKNGVMLLIMIDDKEPQDQQAGNDAADDFSRQIEIPKGSGHCGQQQKSGRKYIPPTPDGVVIGVCFSGLNQFFTGPHVMDSNRGVYLLLMALFCRGQLK